MGKIQLQSLSITLDKPTPYYTLGENVTGYCCIALNGYLDISKLEIKLYGSAETEWSETETVGTGDDRRSEEVFYRSSHIYLNISYLPSVDSTNPRVLTPGGHSIPFNFLIPMGGIANSFEGKFGKIRYFVEGIIHKKGLLKRKHEVKAPIYIQFPVVSEEELRTPIAYSNDKTIGCCSKSSVELKANIAHTGQRTGSSTSVNCTIDNRSNKTMQLRAKLKQIINFKANGRTKFDKNDILTAIGSAIGPQMATNESLLLSIPAGLPLLYNECNIIKMNYKIVVTLDIPGSIDLNVKLPVILTNQELSFVNT